MTNPDQRSGEHRLFGRDRHLRELGLVLDALGEGRGNLVLVAGDAGMGKTRLAEEAVRLARDAGVETARVTCWADAGAPPFWPWTELLGAITEQPTDLTEVDDGTRPDLELARFRRFDAVARDLSAAGRERPWLLVIDDLHWADVPSLRLLSFVAPTLHESRVAVLAAYRDGEADLAHGLGGVLPDLLRHGRHLVLPPLDADQLAALVHEMTGREPARDSVDHLAWLTRGNPLFARELVNLDADLTAPVPLPETVRATLTRRLASVTPRCRDVLDAASVLGVEFTLELPAALLEIDERDVLDALDEAVRARLVREIGVARFEFAHPLTRDVAYRALGLAHRVREHERVGEALETMRAAGASIDPAELAYHFRNAAAGGNAAKARAYAEEAAHRAMATLAYEAAVTNYEHALEACRLHTVPPEHRTELLLQLGEARAAVGEAAAAREAFEEAAASARERGRADQLARAALGLGSGSAGFEVAPFDAVQIALLEEALDALGDADRVLRAWLLARLSVAAGLNAAEDERRRHLAEQAVDMVRDAGDPTALAYALSAHCDAIAGPACVEQRIAEATEIVALALASGDVRMELLGRRLRLVALLEMGRTADVDAEIERYARACDAVRQPLYSWYVPLWRGMRALMESRFDDALGYCDEAERIGAAGNSQNSEMMTKTLKLWTDVHTGNAAGAAAECEDWVRRWPELGSMSLPVVACAQWLAGRATDARVTLDRVRLEDMTEAAFGAEWLECMAMLGLTAGRLGGHPLAAPVYDALVPYRERWAIDGIGGAVVCVIEHPLALLARALGRADVNAHFEGALDAYRRAGATSLHAQAVADAGTSIVPASMAPERRGEFRRDGDAWVVDYEGRTARVRHGKGMSDLARLLTQPGREISALDLMSEGAPTVAATGIEALDTTARAAYRRRLAELDAALEDADARGDAAASERLAAERAALLGELGAAAGLGGRARRTGGSADRARSAVTQRVKDALARIAREHPEAGRHLQRSVRTGTACVYEPDGPVAWTVGLRA